MKKQLMALAIAAALAAPAAAQAPSRYDAKDSNPATAGASAGGFATMDRNNDGYISRDESRDAKWNSRFSELDKDNDGRLSRNEFDAMEKAGSGASTTGGMGGSVGPAGTQSGSSTSGVGDKPGQKQ